MMNLLLAVHHFPPRYGGGAEWRAYNTAAALQARGHHVQVICVESIESQAEPDLTWVDEKFDGISVRRLSFNLNRSPDPFRWSYDNAWISDHLRDRMVQDRPDVFHLIGGYLIGGGALNVAAALSVPTIVTLTDFWFLCPRITMLRSDGSLAEAPIDPVRCAQCLAEESRRYQVLRQLAPRLMGRYWQGQDRQVEGITERLTFLRAALNGVSAVISPSSFLRSIYVKEGFDPKKIIYCRQGKDFPRLSPRRLRKTESKFLRLGYIGQISWHKGVHLLIESLAQLPGAPVSLVIYGDTHRFPEYTAELMAKASGDRRIRFAGTFHPDRLSEVMQGIDLVVVPSLWYENSPNVILEAFAHQTPVLASRLGGMAELVRDDLNGMKFAAGDPADLARIIQHFLRYPSLLSRLQSGIPAVKTVAEEMDELERLYRAAIDGRPISEAPEFSTLQP